MRDAEVERRDGVGVDKGTSVISAGAVEVAMSYRGDIPGDGGLCIQIYADVDGQDVAIGLDLDQVIGLKPGHHQGALVSANDTR